MAKSAQRGQMLSTRINTVERAFQLAKAGACRSVEDIRNRLSVEGYEDPFGHLSGMAIKRQLGEVMAARGVSRPLEHDDA